MRHDSALFGCIRHGFAGNLQSAAACAVLCWGTAGQLLAAVPPQTEPPSSPTSPEMRLCAAAPDTVRTVVAGVGHAWELHFQLRPVPESAPCLTPDPVCVVPRSVVGLQPVGEAGKLIPPGPVLERWALATEGQQAISERDAQWIRRMNAESLSNSQLDEALRFLGQVTQDDLESRFAWTVEFDVGTIVELRGQPRDATEKLFAATWEVTLFRDRQTPLQVTKLAVQRRDGQWQTLRLPLQSRVETVQLVQHTAAEGQIPPSPVSSEPAPTSVIRFAGGVVEIDVE